MCMRVKKVWKISMASQALLSENGKWRCRAPAKGAGSLYSSEIMDSIIVFVQRGNVVKSIF